MPSANTRWRPEPTPSAGTAGGGLLARETGAQRRQLHHAAGHHPILPLRFASYNASSVMAIALSSVMPGRYSDTPIDSVMCASSWAFSKTSSSPPHCECAPPPTDNQRIVAGGDHHKFLAAVTPDEVLVAHAVLQQPADAGQQHVAGRVAVGIIDLLKSSKSRIISPHGRRSARCSIRW